MQQDSKRSVVRSVSTLTALANVSNDLLPELTRSTHSSLVFLYEASSCGVGVHGPAGASELVNEYYRDYGSSCPLHGIKARFDGAIIPTTRIASRNRYERSAAYSDFFRPRGLDHHLAVRLIPRDRESGEIGLMFNRARQQGEFTDSDIERIRELVPSLSLALRYARELDRARGRTADLEALVLALGDEVPKLLVDADGRILHVQAPVNSPSLGPIITQLRDRGHPVIRAARMLTGDRDGDTPAALLHRIRSPLGTWFRAELALSTGLFRGKPLVIVRLVQEGAKGRAEWSRWRLSRAESSVLTELVAGGTNVEIGNRLFISPETVRTHLTRIFKKLGVRSRLEAVVVALQSRGQKARTR